MQSYLFVQICRQITFFLQISEIRVRISSFVFANSYANWSTNSYANSEVKFVHEFVIFDKLGKISYEFGRIREGYVTNGLYGISYRKLSPEELGKDFFRLFYYLL